MNIKYKIKNLRDKLQQGIYVVINPFVRFLIKCGVTANTVTTIGMLGNLAAAAVFIWCAVDISAGQPTDYAKITLAGALIIAFSLFDMLDGQVARMGNSVSAFGALYDSVLDRYCEVLTLGGIAFYLISSGNLAGAIITFAALLGSVMVSYVRARAEGIGIECKMGFMQRPERVVLTSIAAIATGITGLCISSESDFEPNIILSTAMLIIAVFANMTAFARLAHCRKQLSGKQ